MRRVESVDFGRGLVMLLMALDHVRDLMHVTSTTQSPTDLSTTSPALFFTRWITHLCAPTFVFLSGTSAWLSLRNGDRASSGKNLLRRGISLIILDFTLVNFGVWFDVHFQVFIFDVLSAIGCGLIVLGLLRNCSSKAIATLGLAIIFLHNLTGFLPPAPALSMPARIVLALFRPDAFQIFGSKILIVGYPPIPWIGVLLVGFAAGRLFELPTERRKSLFLKAGLSTIAAFIVLRGINVYGDSLPWSEQKNGLYTFLSFLNVTKYPPSLQFCLLFPGGMLLLLSAAEGTRSRYTAFVSVYGRVPLFYFLIHWYLIHPLVFLMVWMQGFKSSDLVFGTNFGRPASGSGVPLWAVYMVWIGSVIALYPLCKWYGEYKEGHKEKAWLRYL